MRFINAFPDIIHRIQKIILIQISKRAARIKIVAATDMNGNGIGSPDFGKHIKIRCIKRFYQRKIMQQPFSQRFKIFFGLENSVIINVAIFA